jgi:hypothetical protein
MRELERHLYRTTQLAIRFFRDAHMQGFSPTLLLHSEGFEVVVWG